MHFLHSFILGLAVMAGGAANAQDWRSIIYAGGGGNRSDSEYSTDKTPFSIGIMGRSGGGRAIVGLDLAREGTMLDSTWNQNQAISQGSSVNLLLGSNLTETGRFSLDAAAILGVRTTAADCPRSYLGYQCYANRTPETSYRGNFGAVVTMSYDRMTLGVRATGQSSQLVAGFRF